LGGKNRRRAKDGGGEGSQTEPAKKGAAVPYFPKVPFEASHLSLGNANIASYFRRIGDFPSWRISNGTFSIFISK
jgi:hypothetical protein